MIRSVRRVFASRTALSFGAGFVVGGAAAGIARAALRQTV
jgi:hypothetical protein